MGNIVIHFCSLQAALMRDFAYVNLVVNELQVKRVTIFRRFKSLPVQLKDWLPQLMKNRD